MRANKVEYNNVVIKDTRLTLDQIEGRTVDLELVIRPADKDNLYKKFELCFAENEKYHSTLCFRPDESVLKNRIENSQEANGRWFIRAVVW